MAQWPAVRACASSAEETRAGEALALEEARISPESSEPTRRGRCRLGGPHRDAWIYYAWQRPTDAAHLERAPARARRRSHALAGDRHGRAGAAPPALRPQLGRQQPPTSRRARNRLQVYLSLPAGVAARWQLRSGVYRTRLVLLAKLAAESTLLRIRLAAAVPAGGGGARPRGADAPPRC